MTTPVGAQLLQGAEHGPSRARAVVPDAEDLDACTAHVSQLAARPVEVGPVAPVLDHGLEVLLPDDPVLHRVLDDRANQTGGDVVGPHDAVTEVRGQRDAVGHDGDRLRGREGRRGRLDRRALVGGDAGAELAEDRDDALDLRERLETRRQLEAAAQGVDAGADDLDLLLERVGQRQHDGVEASLERRREVVDALVAVVRRRDDVEALAAPAPRRRARGWAGASPRGS